MKIALLGYGKNGPGNWKNCKERNCFEKDENNTYEGLSTADVAIDFSDSSVQYLQLFSC
jgi:4-hydroxy-tetrahydrodipicolinate reductase